MTSKEWYDYKMLGARLVPELRRTLEKCNSLVRYLEAIKVGYYSTHKPEEYCFVEVNEYSLEYIIQAIKEWLNDDK